MNQKSHLIAIDFVELFIEHRVDDTNELVICLPLEQDCLNVLGSILKRYYKEITFDGFDSELLRQEYETLKIVSYTVKIRHNGQDNYISLSTLSDEFDYNDSECSYTVLDLTKYKEW